MSRRCRLLTPRTFQPPSSRWGHSRRPRGRGRRYLWCSLAAACRRRSAGCCCCLTCGRRTCCRTPRGRSRTCWGWSSPRPSPFGAEWASSDVGSSLPANRGRASKSWCPNFDTFWRRILARKTMAIFSERRSVFDWTEAWERERKIDQRFCASLSLDSAVWPDLTIFIVTWHQIFLQKKAKHLVTFWSFLKPTAFLSKICFGYFVGKICNFLATFYFSIWSHYSLERDSKSARSTSQSVNKIERSPALVVTRYKQWDCKIEV